MTEQVHVEWEEFDALVANAPNTFEAGEIVERARVIGHLQGCVNRFEGEMRDHLDPVGREVLRLHIVVFKGLIKTFADNGHHRSKP